MSSITEVRRRNLIRVAMACMAMAWLVAQSLAIDGRQAAAWRRGLLRQQGTGEDQIAAIGIDALFPGPGLPPTVPVSPP